jgi:hypothetical protein
MDRMAAQEFERLQFQQAMLRLDPEMVRKIIDAEARVGRLAKETEGPFAAAYPNKAGGLLSHLGGLTHGGTLWTQHQNAEVVRALRDAGTNEQILGSLIGTISYASQILQQTGKAPLAHGVLASTNIANNPATLILNDLYQTEFASHAGHLAVPNVYGLVQHELEHVRGAYHGVTD